jgi:hypothetical protein
VAKVHAERINQLAGQLAAEIRFFKACADRISPMYWQVYYKPFITGFKTISVPHFRSRNRGLDNCQPYTLKLHLYFLLVLKTKTREHPP